MTKFIAIDGHGGSGKTSLADHLASELKAEVVRTDDFASYDNPLNWWPLVIEQVFKPIQDGAKTLSYPRSKWWEDHDPEPVIDQQIADIMILEGVSSSRREFRDNIDYAIYVDTPKEICLQRGLDRDKGQDGKSDEEIMAIWEQWFKDEDAYIKRDNPRENADLVVDGTKPVGGDDIARIKELIDD